MVPPCLGRCLLALSALFLFISLFSPAASIVPPKRSELEAKAQTHHASFEDFKQYQAERDLPASPRGWAPHHRTSSPAKTQEKEMKPTSFKEETSRHLASNVARFEEMEGHLGERDATAGPCWPYSFESEKNDNLGTCCWYGFKSCCTSRFAPSIVPAIQHQLKRVKENGTHSECYLAVADLLCLWCHPSTSDFVQGNLQRPELHICLSTCEKLWNACKDQQSTFGITPPASTARQFCAALLVEEENEDDGNEGGVNVIIVQNNKACYAGVPLVEVEASGCSGDKKADSAASKGTMPTGLIVAMIVVPLLGVCAIAVAIGLFAWHHKKKLEADSQGFSIPVDSFPTADHLLGSGSDDDVDDGDRRGGALSLNS